MEDLTSNFFFALLVIIDRICSTQSFNIGTGDPKIFSGRVEEEFGYTVQQFKNHQGKWLLVGAPWGGFTRNRKGDVYKCPVSGPSTSCDELRLHDDMIIPNVRNVDTNMSLGLTLTRMPETKGLLTCGPLWAQRCGSQDYYPGVCAELSPLFRAQPAFSPAVQPCGGPMDIVIVLDGSNSIYPWEPMNMFLEKLIPALDIGPQSTQVSVIQYGVTPQFEFRLRDHRTKESLLAAVTNITQMFGDRTNTFEAIKYASKQGFNPMSGARPGAAKVMVVVTDGESHDEELRANAIDECEKLGITRFAIAVLGYYIRNNIDTKNLIAEIKSIASSPVENFFFNVSEEAALSKIAGALGNRIFNIEGTGKGADNFQMEMSQVGFSAHYAPKQNVLMLGAVGAYAWSGTVVHKTDSRADIFPFTAFEKTLQEGNHSSLLGYAVTSLSDGAREYFVAGAPRSNHSGQVVVYTVNGQKEATVVDTERGKQIGSYFGSALCSLDVDGDGTSDLLLVGAPMFMSALKKEQGRVYLFSITKGILNEHGFLSGPSASENSRFGMAISAVPDLDLDGFSDVVVGAPLEDQHRGVLYVYNGQHKALNKAFSQRILGSELDPKLQYFGRSIDGHGDLNDDTIPDVSVGAYGKVVQLWSCGLATVTAKASFTPDKISILSKPCLISGRKVSCFSTKICFTAVFRPKNPIGPIDLSYNLTLDADLQSSHVTSRGLFTLSNDRLLSRDVKVLKDPVCQDYQVLVQDTPDFVNSISLRVDVALRQKHSNPVLDVFSPSAWEFFIPFLKECGSDKVCVSDLSLSVKRGPEVPSSGPMLVSYNKRVSFEVAVKNKLENAYNTQLLVKYSSSLFYAFASSPKDGTSVICTSTTQEMLVACQVGYPALKTGQEVKFLIHFDFNLDELHRQAEVIFEVKSDSKEDRPSDNKKDVSISLQYNAGLTLSRQSNINFYVVNQTTAVQTELKSLNDIGPEFQFSVKISTDNFPVNLLYLTIAIPMTTKAGNPLLYITGLKTQAGGSTSCDSRELVDPLKIGGKPNKVSFTKESLRDHTGMACEETNCHVVKCILKDMEAKNHYYVNVTTRIWSGTFSYATFQTVDLTSKVEIESSQPDLLLIKHRKLEVTVTVSKPGEIADVPIGVIVGSIIGGLLLLALAVGLMWKFGFFKRKYKKMQTDAAEEMELNAPEDEGEEMELNAPEDEGDL
ncbi:integrin alpha-2 isoform X2 [Gadus macrocephalus]|uniref:integrin alpha-2 isoform X2 n=1 Tax=Gadus macrocephalus TaxID=80720 RepID=UPI0028CBB2B9|nr:integrin alpha-2 isoform X2 [Gadus macrocephalus]